MMQNFWNGGECGYGWSGWGMGGSILMVLFWASVIAAIVVLARWLFCRGGSCCMRKTAVDILKERYAKGEIDKEEFERVKKNIE